MKKVLVFLVAVAGMLGAAAGKLEIYHIDVEGGAATLIVGPAGESLLVDTGNPASRRPRRPEDTRGSNQAGRIKAAR